MRYTTPRHSPRCVRGGTGCLEPQRRSRRQLAAYEEGLKPEQQQQRERSEREIPQLEAQNEALKAEKQRETEKDKREEH